MAKIASTVTKDPETGLFTFTCPGDPADPCGVPGGVNYRSSDWPTAEIAAARGQQHIESHVHKTEMQPVADFRAEHGVVEPEGGSSVEAVDLSVYLNPKEK